MLDKPLCFSSTKGRKKEGREGCRNGEAGRNKEGRKEGRKGRREGERERKEEKKEVRKEWRTLFISQDADYSLKA